MTYLLLILISNIYKYIKYKINTLKEVFKTDVGYSDHTNGIEISIAAVALGARIIEKHFTLNRTFKGTDHVFSLEPQGMQKMVRDLKRSALALGDGEKIIYADEAAPIKKMGKMIIAARDLQAGHQVNFEDLEFRSPAEGLPPSFAGKIVGKVLKQELKKHSPLTLEMFN